ncbi:hypothetical protein DFP72DRAFT_811588 [Ephemerocybe angulata]|uniref:Uncharacterized protein n=1 Tax=Ephemerocybe angulata TaxID=980116 RepID=A0A8H6HZV9_9AGAR|nr:hypothetical protein DFP72DRAFT_811588 [Tulosesus angulatus]
MLNFQQHQQIYHQPSSSNTKANVAGFYTAGSSSTPGYNVSGSYAAYNGNTYRNVGSTSAQTPHQSITPQSLYQSQVQFQSQAQGTSISTPAPPTFRAPAHKNSHHLHSIPPREKSTRTLIVDHMLWVHGRTRLAQARAELGMTDRTGGPSTTNYSHRTRPENFEEDEEVESDGEDVNVLLDSPSPPENKTQDLALARTLRLRAEGLEKVVTSMLGQPPPSPFPHPVPTHGHSLHPHLDSTSAASHPSTRTGRHPHILPNGVRLRLALGTIVNDFFAREDPSASALGASGAQAKGKGVAEGVQPLMRISGAARFLSMAEDEEEESEDETGGEPELTYPPEPPQSMASIYDDSTYGFGSSSGFAPSSFYQGHQQIQRENKPVGLSPFAAPGKIPKPSTRVLELYGAGVGESLDEVGRRCARHLTVACGVCVDAAPGSRSGFNPKSKSSSSKSKSGFGSINVGVSVGAGVGMVGAMNSARATADGGGITGWKDGVGVGAGLRGLEPGESVLRRGGSSSSAASPTKLSKDEDKKAKDGSIKRKPREGSTKLVKLIPRFIKLSALVAGELGREVRGEEHDQSHSHSHHSHHHHHHHHHLHHHRHGKRAHQKMYHNALQPTREWYLLLAGLLTRAVLEGYLSGGWKGIEGVLAVLGVGVSCERRRGRLVSASGVSSRSASKGPADVKQEEKDSFHLGRDEEDEDDALFEEVEPDEYPTLREAVKVLFPSLRGRSKEREHGRKDNLKGDAEKEYEDEMKERLALFLDIPSTTASLSAHLEELAKRFPAEPVERAAIRFCEAIAKWRGKPELEMVSSFASSNPNFCVFGSAMAGMGMMSPGVSGMESFVHSNPTSPVVASKAKEKRKRKTGIGAYFSAGAVDDSQSGSGGGLLGKREREEDLTSALGGVGKKARV